MDLSPGMIRVARRENPGIGFAAGSMTDLPLRDGSVGGVVAFWSLVHVPDEAIAGVLGEFRRVLRPGAPLLIGFHLGDGARLKTEGYGGHPMHVHVYRRPAQRVAEWLNEAGFVVSAQLLLDLDGRYPGAVLSARRVRPQESAN
jgi:SAM-dependent methyltransferase